MADQSNGQNSGYGREKLGTDRVDEFTSGARRVSERVMDSMRDFPARSREIVSRVDRHAHTYPWLHIGLVGAGALMAGFIVGKSSSRSVSKRGYSTSMGRRYEDFDDALDE